MTAPTDLLMITTLLLALSLVGIKSKADSRAGGRTDQGKSAAEGKATIRYWFSDLAEGISIAARIPVTIKRDEVYRDRWQVRGSQLTTCSTWDPGSLADGSASSLHRNFPVRIFFDGVLLTNPGENGPGCQFQLKNFFVTEVYESGAGGSQQENNQNSSQTFSTSQAIGALPEKNWVFDRDNRTIHVPGLEGQNLSASISYIQWPAEIN